MQSLLHLAQLVLITISYQYPYIQLASLCSAVPVRTRLWHRHCRQLRHRRGLRKI